MKVKVVVGPSAEGGYSATVVGLAGSTYEAESREEAIERVREALSLYLDGEKHQIEIEAADTPHRARAAYS